MKASERSTASTNGSSTGKDASVNADTKDEEDDEDWLFEFASSTAGSMDAHNKGISNAHSNAKGGTMSDADIDAN